MPDKSQKKEETKKLVRSILATTPVQLGVKLTDFLKDYRDLAGGPLPIAQLGYNNDQDFLCDIPDVVHVSYERGEVILRCIANESMQHVMNLVNNQKVSAAAKKRRFRPSRPSGYGGGAPSRYSGPPPNRRFSSRPPSNRYESQARPPPGPRFRNKTNYDQQEPARPNVKPVVKPFVQNKIYELCWSHKRGLLGSEFQNACIQRYNREVNFREMGFSTLLEMFQTLDFIEVMPMEGGDFKLFAKKNSPPGYGKLSEEPKPTVQQNKPTANNTAKGEVKSRFSREDLKKDIQAVLAEHPDGIWAAFFTEEYKQITGRELCAQRLGFCNIVELLGGMPDVVSITRPIDNDWLLKTPDEQPSPQQPQEKNVEAGDSQKAQLRKGAGRGRGKPGVAASAAAPGRQYSTAPQVSGEVRERLRQVLQNNPDGVPMVQLTTVHKEQSGHDLDWRALGYSHLETLLKKLDDVAEIRYVHDMYCVYAKDDGTPVRTDLLLPPPPPPQQHGCRVPEDAVGPGCAYSLPGGVVADTEQFVAVYVSHVHAIDNLCIQLSETTHALEELMDQLEETYWGAEGERYSIPVPTVHIGQVCVAVYPEDNNWHRVRVTALQGDFAEVEYVDYGSSQWVPANSLKYLKNEYLFLPAQAIKAKLGNLRLTEKGKKQGQKEMLNLVTNKSLFAIIIHVDKDDVASICLCDTSNGDLWINDYLCENGFAELEPTVTSSPQEVTSPQPVFVPPPPQTPPNTTPTYQSPVNVPVSALSPEDGEMVYQSEEEEDDEEQEGEEAQEDAENCGICRYLKYVVLTDVFSVHLINFEGGAWLLSAEISAFFWEKDLLRSQLRQKKKSFPREVLMRDEHPQIFEEFAHYDVRGSKEDNGELKDHVTIYQLGQVAEIVELFEHPSADLLQAIRSAAANFNPDDPFWKGVDEEEEEDGSEGSSDVSLTKEELEMALEALQIKRKRILREMNDADASSLILHVNELGVLEKQLINVKQQLELRRNGASDVSPAGESKLTEEDHFQLQCVQAQYSDSLGQPLTAQPSLTRSLSQASNSSLTQLSQPMSDPSGNQFGNQFGNQSGDQFGNQFGNQSGNQFGDQSGNPSFAQPPARSASESSNRSLTPSASQSSTQSMNEEQGTEEYEEPQDTARSVELPTSDAALSPPRKTNTVAPMPAFQPMEDSLQAMSLSESSCQDPSSLQDPSIQDPAFQPLPMQQQALFTQFQNMLKTMPPQSMAPAPPPPPHAQGQSSQFMPVSGGLASSNQFQSMSGSVATSQHVQPTTQSGCVYYNPVTQVTQPQSNQFQPQPQPGSVNVATSQHMQPIQGQTSKSGCVYYNTVPQVTQPSQPQMMPFQQMPMHPPGNRSLYIQQFPQLPPPQSLQQYPASQPPPPSLPQFPSHPPPRLMQPWSSGPPMPGYMAGMAPGLNPGYTPEMVPGSQQQQQQQQPQSYAPQQHFEWQGGGMGRGYWNDQ